MTGDSSGGCFPARRGRPDGHLGTILSPPGAWSYRDGIKTTPEEIEGFHIVKAIARQAVAPDRIVHRDTKSYMGILVNDNNRKPICRLRFNASQKYLGLLDAAISETKHPIETLDDIYRFAAQIREAAKRYAD